MQIDHNITTDSNFIRSYGEGHIVVVSPLDEPVFEEGQNRQRTHDVNTIEEHVVVTPTHLDSSLLPASPEQLEQSHFKQLIEFTPEIVILGTGKHIRFPDQRLTVELWKNGVGIEVMDSAAACRTYNFLIADGRNVVAAIFMI